MQKFVNIMLFINIFLIHYTIYCINSSIGSLTFLNSSCLSRIEKVTNRLDKQEVAIDKLEDILSAINMAKNR